MFVRTLCNKSYIQTLGSVCKEIELKAMISPTSSSSSSSGEHSPRSGTYYSGSGHQVQSLYSDTESTASVGSSASRRASSAQSYNVTGRRSSVATRGTTKSNCTEGGLSLVKTISKIITAVRDDNEQTAKEEGSLDQVLKSRFDVGDAIRLQYNRTPEETRSFHDEESLTSSNNESNFVGTKSTNDDKDMEPEGHTVQRVFTNKCTGDVQLPPDGGYGWVVTLCVFLVMFSTWGCNSGFGVFLAFYLNENTFEGATKYDYALIAGLTVSLAQAFSPFVMAIMRIVGIKTTMLFGSALMLAGFILASFATELWQLYLTQGVLSGASISFLFIPATTLIPGWFLKRRAAAMGLSLMGTGAGGVTYGLATNKMIANDGNTKWALRVLGISCTVSVLAAIALIKQRNPIPSVGLRSWRLIVKQIQSIFDYKVLRNPFVFLVSVWFTLALLGYNLMVFTLSSYAIARGMSPHQGSILTAVLNGAQTIGRPLMGLAGDRFGRSNVTITLTTLITVLLFGFWIPAQTFVQLLIFSIFIGSCLGVANVMSTVLIADNMPPDQFLAAWSWVNLSSSPVLLVCEVIAQSLTVPENKKNPYLHTQIFAGCCYGAALVMISILREYSVRIKLNERRRVTNLKVEEWTHYEHDLDEHNLDQEWMTLNERKKKYDLLLKPGIKQYFLRMSYPMKV